MLPSQEIQSAPQKPPKISVVIPIYKTEKYLHELYARLIHSLEQVSTRFEIILVEDHSGDRCWDIILDLAKHDQRVIGMKLSRNFGQHPALSIGFEQATGDFIVLMDADLQDRPEDIPRLIQELNDDVDIVYTLKQNEKRNYLTQVTSKLYHYIFSRIAKVNVPENIGTFRAFKKNFLQAILLYKEKNILYGPLMFYIGFKSKFVPVTHDQRQFDRSSYTFLTRLSLAFNSLISYTDIPMKIMVYIGIVILLLSLAYGIAILISYLIFGRLLEKGITLILVSIMAFMGATMLSLGIIGIYIFRIYQEVLRRPRCIVARTVNLLEKCQENHEL